MQLLESSCSPPISITTIFFSMAIDDPRKSLVARSYATNFPMGVHSTVVVVVKLLARKRYAEPVVVIIEVGLKGELLSSYEAPTTIVDASSEMAKDDPNTSPSDPSAATSRVICVHDDGDVNDREYTNALPTSPPLASSAP
jgi:hypothetical protein